MLTWTRTVISANNKQYDQITFYWQSKVFCPNLSASLLWDPRRHPSSALCMCWTISVMRALLRMVQTFSWHFSGWKVKLWVEGKLWESWLPMQFVDRSVLDEDSSAIFCFLLFLCCYLTYLPINNQTCSGKEQNKRLRDLYWEENEQNSSILGNLKPLENKRIKVNYGPGKRQQETCRKPVYGESLCTNQDKAWSVK